MVHNPSTAQMNDDGVFTGEALFHQAGVVGV